MSASERAPDPRRDGTSGADPERIPPPTMEPDMLTAARMEELAGALASSGQMDDALAYLKRAATTFEGSADLRAAQCFRGCAELAAALGRMDEAARLFAAAGDSYSAMGWEAEQAACELRRGEVLRTAGKPAAAQAGFEAAWTRHESEDDEVGAAYAALGVATVLRGRGQSDAALYVVERVDALLEAAASPDVYFQQALARTAAVAGMLLTDCGRHAEARRCLSRARAWFEDHGETVDAARVDVSMSEVERAAGHCDAARTALAGARAEFEAAGMPAEAAVCRARSALVLMDQWRVGDAVDALEEAVSTLRARGWTVASAEAELELGVARLRLGNAPAACKHIERAREVFLDAGLSMEAERADGYLLELAASAASSTDSPTNRREDPSGH